jgi:hypothetical protein
VRSVWRRSPATASTPPACIGTSPRSRLRVTIRGRR